MFNNKTIKNLILLLFVISILVAFTTTFGRLIYERTNKNIELVAAYTEVNKLAFLAVEKETIVLNQLKSLGINNLALEEETLEDLQNNGQISLIKGSDILAYLRLGTSSVFKPYLKRLKPDYVYLVTSNQKLLKRIITFLKADLGEKSIVRLNPGLIGIAGDYNELKSLGVGLDLALIKKLTDQGFFIMPRLINSPRVSLNLIKLKFDQIKKIQNVSALIFKGDTVLGYPLKIDLVRDEIKALKINFGLIEFFDQLGIDALARKLPYLVERVHSIPEEEIIGLTDTKAVKRYVRAVRERGVKIVFLHPFWNNPYNETVLTYNLNYFQTIIKHLNKDGFKINSTSNFPVKTANSINIFSLFFLSTGVFITFIYFLTFFLNLKPNNIKILTILYIVGFLGFCMLHLLPTWIKIFALTSTIIFPTLAIIKFFPKTDQKESLLSSFNYLFNLFMTTLLGVLFNISFLNNISYLKGITIFSGVKFAFVIPLFLVAYYFYFNTKDLSTIYYKLKRLINAYLKISMVVIGLGLLVMLAIYIIRSGNFMAGKIPGFEKESRDFLEQLFWLRPRTKEFLIGFPILLLAFYYRKYLQKINFLWLINMIGTIALISITNSFCHTYTPLMVSLYRSIVGLILGYGLGLLLIFAIKGVISYSNFLHKKP
ncbi:MAG: DUF5693 family protein [Candidatus Margulisiibacteriota bacterium]|jgi:hypothetical protein